MIPPNPFHPSLISSRDWTLGIYNNTPPFHDTRITEEKGKQFPRTSPKFPPRNFLFSHWRTIIFVLPSLHTAPPSTATAAPHQQTIELLLGFSSDWMAPFVSPDQRWLKILIMWDERKSLLIFRNSYSNFVGFYGLLLICLPHLRSDHSQIPNPGWPWWSFIHNPCQFLPHCASGRRR